MHLNHGYSYREVPTRSTLGRWLEAAPPSVLEYLTDRYPHSSRAEWQQRLEDGEVSLSGHIAEGTEPVRIGLELIWNRPPWTEADVPLNYEVVYQDADLLAVAKPSGLPTLPGGGFLDHTLLHQVRRTVPEAAPLHRLGRGTSGLVLFARTKQAAASLSRNWREHEIQKTYLALAAGISQQERLDIRVPIGPVPHPRLGTVFAASPIGKASHSTATVLERRADTTLFSVDIMTGRPHQIRIHLAAAGQPLVGDPLYAAGGLPLPELPGLPGDGGYLLHAFRLGFMHPVTGEQIRLTVPPPEALMVGREA